MYRETEFGILAHLRWKSSGKYSKVFFTLMIELKKEKREIFFAWPQKKLQEVLQNEWKWY